MKVNITISGAMSTGKSTLARLFRATLAQYGICADIDDVDYDTGVWKMSTADLEKCLAAIAEKHEFEIRVVQTKRPTKPEQLTERDLIAKLKQAVADAPPYKRFHWLPDDYSTAFMVCAGAGPWKFKRRQEVQEKAVAFLNGRDISRLHRGVDCYPLQWQNDVVLHMANFLRGAKLTMTQFCEDLIKIANENGQPFEALRWLHEAAGMKKRVKVVSLFARDRLNIPAFPMDRHVQRWLKKYTLPQDEDQLVELCQKAGLDPREVATAFVQTGLDTGNPDHR